MRAADRRYGFLRWVREGRTGSGARSVFLFRTSCRPCHGLSILTAVVRRFPDSVTVAGDSEFLAGGMRRWLLGDNYRKEWSVPLKVKVFDMTGWTPLERGGGNETRSLRIVNAQGVSYVLRGVKKYVTTDALPAMLTGRQICERPRDGWRIGVLSLCLFVDAASGAGHAGAACQPADGVCAG